LDILGANWMALTSNFVFVLYPFFKVMWIWSQHNGIEVDLINLRM
jgi:hypothetical protein